MIDVKKILATNEDRLIDLARTYNPLTGVGSLIERFEFRISTQRSIWLPIMMQTDKMVQDIIAFDTLEKYVNYHFDINRKHVTKLILTELSKARMAYDFEFWAFTTVQIKNKHSGRYSAFKLNRPQRKLLAKLMEDIVTGVPIRLIIGKARQWGGSTLVQFFFVWIQLLIKSGWSSTIIADLESQANNVRSMIRRASKTYPQEINQFKLVPFEKSNKNVELVGRDECAIFISSMQKPDSIRSANIYLAHLTEVGMWKKTDGKSPEDVIQSVMGTVNPLPYTAVVIESTAKGVGNYFYNQYTSAKNGTSEFKHFFASWFDNEKNTMEIKGDIEAFVLSLDSYELWLFEIGATLQQINWYRYKKRTEYSGSLELTWRIFEEIPSDDNEMFQSTGSRVFPNEYVTAYRSRCIPPRWRGEIRGQSLIGENSMKEIEFIESTHGRLLVWVKPEFGDDRYKNRYVVVVDIGGKSEKADNSVITVLDNMCTHDGGLPEVCATWVGHIDHDVLAWMAVQICLWYDTALLVIENNSLEREEVEGTEGNHFETVLNEIVDYYDNIYCTQQNLSKIKQGLPAVYGYNTNKTSKPLVVNFLYKCLRDSLYYEYEIEVCAEYDVFELKANGTYGAKDKCHDDRLMTRAIGLWVCYNDAPLPELVSKNTYIKKKTGGVSSF